MATRYVSQSGGAASYAAATTAGNPCTVALAMGSSGMVGDDTVYLVSDHIALSWED